MTANSVSGRVNVVREQLTPAQLAVGLVVVAAIGFVLAFMQDPLVHDSLHAFRHSVGITCH